MPVSPVMQRKYIPIIAITTAIHTFFGTCFFKNIPNIGTIIMYNDVINPAFPTEVYLMPICWNDDATKRAIPQHMPPIMSVRLSFGSADGLFSFPLNLSTNFMMGIRIIPPITFLEKRYVNGST